MITIIDLKYKHLPIAVQQQVADYVLFLYNKYHYRKKTEKKIIAGCMKGTFSKMAEDFNAPLQMFKDYQ